MNVTLERVRLYAKQLRLPTFANPEQLIREARTNQCPYEEFLVQLLQTEAEQGRRIKRKGGLRQPSFPHYVP